MNKIEVLQIGLEELKGEMEYIYDMLKAGDPAASLILHVWTSVEGMLSICRENEK